MKCMMPAISNSLIIVGFSPTVCGNNELIGSVTSKGQCSTRTLLDCYVLAHLSWPYCCLCCRWAHAFAVTYLNSSLLFGGGAGAGWQSQLSTITSPNQRIPNYK